MKERELPKLTNGQLKLQKEKAIQEAVAKFNKICRDPKQAVAFWQVLHTPELDKALERRRQWEAHSITTGGQKVIT